jgi:medium-chain acyl-[acyl-carrier-protein] hydrolase
MSLLIDALTVAMRPYLSRPFAFFGHSMGALISFELARRLIMDGQPGPRHLFVAAHRAPQLRDDRPFLHTQPEPAFVEQVSIRYAALPKQIAEDPELMRLFMPTLRADLAVCETYEYHEGAPLDCPISVFGGWQDNGVSCFDLDAWRLQTTAQFSVRMFAGDHFLSKERKLSCCKRSATTWLESTLHLSPREECVPQDRIGRHRSLHSRALTIGTRRSICVLATSSVGSTLRSRA